MNIKVVFTTVTGVLVTCLGLVSNAQGATIVTSKRIFQNISTNMSAKKVDIILPATAGGNGYSWLKIKEVNNNFPGNDPAFDVPIPMPMMNGGTILNFMPDRLNIDPTKNLEVVTSAKKKDNPLPASQVVFKKVDGTEIGIDDRPTAKVSLQKRGSHDSTTDGLGGSSEFAMILQNLSTDIIIISGLKLFQNIDMPPFIAALESTLPDNLYTDPINTIGSGELVNNIMPDFTLNPGEELAFHFDDDFDPNKIAISSGFCNGDFECSDSVMTPVTEPTSVLGILGTLGAGATIKRKLNPSKSTEKETTKLV